jgi:hypothetical protein
MNELDLVDHVELVEQDGADQAIEIAARHEAIFHVGHVSLPNEVSVQANAGAIGVKRSGQSQGNSVVE